mgnify:CR=1 FL=1
MEIKRYDKLAIFFKKEKIIIYNLSILLSTAFTLFIENRIIMGSWVRLYVPHTKSCLQKDIGLIFAAVCLWCIVFIGYATITSCSLS